METPNTKTGESVETIEHSAKQSELEFVCWLNSNGHLDNGRVLPLDLKGKTALRLTADEILKWRTAASHFGIPVEVAQAGSKLQPGRQPKYMSQAARRRARRLQNRVASAKRRSIAIG
jgi:hypothetical protein